MHASTNPIEKSDRRLSHAAAPVRTDRHLRWLDDVDHRQVPHFLDARGLVRTQEQSSVDLVAHVDLPLEPVVLERQLRRLAILPVALEEILELRLRLPQLRALFAHLSLGERALGSSLLLPLGEIVDVDLIEEVPRDLQRKLRIARR